MLVPCNLRHCELAVVLVPNIFYDLSPSLGFLVWTVELAVQTEHFNVFVVRHLCVMLQKGRVAVEPSLPLA